MGRNYKNRGMVYHLLSNITGVLSATVSAEVLFHHPRDRNGFEYDSLFSWYFYTLPICYLIFTIVIIGISVHYVKTHEVSPVTRFLKYTTIYLSVFAGFRLLPFILVNFMSGLVTDFNDNIWITFLLLIWYTSGSAVFLARLYEPTIRYYIKDQVQILCTQLKHCRQRATIPARSLHAVSTNSSQNSLLAIRIFDEVKLDILESISMAISILMFNYTDPDSALPLEIQKSHFSKKSDLKDIKYKDLEILLDPSLQSRCKVYLDPKFYLEYKTYAKKILQDIMFRDRVSPQDIANDFLIQDNQIHIQKAVEEEQYRDKLFSIKSASAQFIIRAVTKEEHKLLTHRMMESYYYRVISGSFLQHVYGVFKFSLKGNVYRIVLLDNPAHILKQPNYIKIQGQKLSAKQNLMKTFVAHSKINEISSNPSFLCEKVQDSCIHLRTDVRETVSEILNEDLDLLRQHSIIHYDLLVYYSRFNAESLPNRCIFPGEGDQTTILLCFSNYFYDERTTTARKTKRIASVIKSEKYSRNLEIKFRSMFSGLI